MLLNDMDLQAMARMADDLDAVRAALAILADRGLVARADLTPGQPMVIRLVRGMPDVVFERVLEPVIIANAAPVLEPAPPKECPPQTEEEIRLSGEIFKAAYDAGRPDAIQGMRNLQRWAAEQRAHRDASTVCEDAPVSFKPPADADPDQHARAAGLVDNEGFEIEPAATPITDEAPPEGNAGESVVPAPEPAVTGPGEVEAEATAPGPQPAQGRWTEEETARLVEIIADRMVRRGDTLRAAAEVASEILAHPIDGTYFKARSLVERIEAARRVLVDRTLDRLAPAAAVPAPEPEPQAEPEAAPVQVFNPEPAPAQLVNAAPLTPTGELHQHLAAVKRDDLWTIRRDHDLMHFSLLRWPAGDIALEIKVPVAEIKQRFNVLTAARKFKAADVLAALDVMLDRQAA